MISIPWKGREGRSERDGKGAREKWKGRGGMGRQGEVEGMRRDGDAGRSGMSGKEWGGKEKWKGAKGGR